MPLFSHHKPSTNKQEIAVYSLCAFWGKHEHEGELLWHTHTHREYSKQKAQPTDSLTEEAYLFLVISTITSAPFYLQCPDFDEKFKIHKKEQEK